MVPEAPLERSEIGLTPKGDGWFVVNARDARWMRDATFGDYCVFEGETDFPQFGINIHVVEPGQPNGMYHAESNQEAFLVLSGECLLIVEGEERPLRQWDYFHCPPETPHVLVAAGDAPFVYVAFGPRQKGSSLVYAVDEIAQKRGASVDKETSSGEEAYAGRAYRFGPYPGGLPAYDSRSAR